LVKNQTDTQDQLRAQKTNLPARVYD